MDEIDNIWNGDPKRFLHSNTWCLLNGRLHSIHKWGNPEIVRHLKRYPLWRERERERERGGFDKFLGAFLLNDSNC